MSEDYYDLGSKFLSGCGYKPIKIILDVLSLQTDLSNLVDFEYQEYEESGDIALPPDDLVMQWRKHCESWHTGSNYRDFFDAHSVRLGQELSYNKIFELEPVHYLNKYYCVNIRGSLTILPNCVLGFLNQLFLEDLRKLNRSDPQCRFNLSARLYRVLFALFPNDRIIPRFTTNNSDTVDYAVHFDHTKLFLFKIIDASFSDDIQEEVNLTLKQMQRMNKDIRLNGHRLLADGKPGDSAPVEVFPIILFKDINFSLDPRHPLFNFVIQRVLLCRFMDFVSLTIDADSGMKLLKFLRQYRKTHTLFDLSPTPKLLDQYVYYHDRGNSFFNAVSTSEDLRFTSNAWGIFYVHKLLTYHRFLPKLHESPESGVWELFRFNDYAIENVNVVLGHISVAFQVSGIKIGIHIMNNTDLKHTTDEIDTLEVLSRLFVYRLRRGTAFAKFLKALGFSKKDILDITLNPISVISRTEISFLHDAAYRICKTTPLVVVPTRSLDNRYHAFNIVYSVRSITELFDAGVPDAEKTVVRTLLSRITDLFETTDIDKKRLIDDCMTKLFEDKLYGFGPILTNNKLPISYLSAFDYPHPIKDDIAECYKKIAVFLSNKGILPSTYENHEAKKIIDLTLEFVNGLLDEELSDLNSGHLLLLTLENWGRTIQGKSIWQRRFTLNFEREIDVDTIHEYTQETLEISKSSNAACLVCERTAQTLGGTTICTMEKWYELQGLAHTIQYLKLIRNIIYFEMLNCDITINEKFDFQIIGNHDLEQYHIHQYLSMPKYSMPQIRLHDPIQLAKKLIATLDEPFRDEYGVGLETLLVTLDCCKLLPTEKNTHVLECTKDEIIQYVNKKHSQIPNDEIDAALEMVTFQRMDNLDKNALIMNQATMERAQRSAMRPIFESVKDGKTVLVSNSWLIDASIYNWIFGIMYEDGRHLSLHYGPPKRGGKLDLTLTESANHNTMNHWKNVWEEIKKTTQYCEHDLNDNGGCLQNITESPPSKIKYLAIYPDTRLICLLDTLTVYPDIAYLQGDMTRELKKYLSNMDKTKQYVKRHQRSILGHYGIQSNGKPWQIICKIVTKIGDLNYISIGDNKFISVDMLDSIKG